ncbi:MAG: isomerase [Gallionellales bacterium 35-53-114]|jgi:ketosteroid isomerase-like protein|nr:MAG: isomerase [Gallionellales bacterium 35-53-114]OYZ63027.1 MAG: isomerase [Gallionellales bacterium 24-53-125]OZB08991.1 MAG: isomerase [Gallionellales bacterium 39-52-133]HQS59329.1 nuclear transport factor 2 family protein [Gallionellaceae bacterium]HQS76242.1 nuclear transport factor 2 family protein [Gallionellaceae bacterium]
MNADTGSAQNHAASLQQVVNFFETLTPASLKNIAQIYDADAFFKDPFNEVRGLAPITRIFEHMFSQVANPRFVVTLQMAQGHDAFLTWNFLFRMKRDSADEHCIRGATHLRFNSCGLVDLHRDYWDAAEELYEKLPLLGALMRLLKRAARK